MTTSGAGWTELAIEAAGDDLDTVAEVLADFAPGAVWVEPAIATSNHRDFAYTVLASGGTVRAAVEAWSAEQRAALEARLAGLELRTPPGPVVERPIGDHDWAEEWKRFYHVMHVGRRLVIRPSWEAYTATTDAVVIVLDPGAAFGTGQHPSTQLCLAAIEAETRPGMRVLDLGAGSGILAVAAAILGAADVVAIDIDPEAAAASKANARANGVADRVRSAVGSLGDAWPWQDAAPVEAFDLVVANISSAVLTTLLADITMALRPGGVFIGAGFIGTGAPGVLEAVARAGLVTVREEVLEDDGGSEWRCLIATRAGTA
ncbi:MAG: 50S ribosomal protein L11 methyltransferase [Dehalococcoidia bacterium]|nr:50S ribosomal protein L11 methyltransferase [Dehalococcoidia bacterium]